MTMRTSLLTAMSAIGTVLAALVLSAAPAASVPSGSPSGPPGHGTPVSPPRLRYPSCFGADALAPPANRCKPVTSGRLTPDLAHVKQDLSPAYRGDRTHHVCIAYPPSFVAVRCDYGTLTGKTRVALVGNSHAATALPAVLAQANFRHWRVSTYLASECAFSYVRLSWPKKTQDNCLHWVSTVAGQIAAAHYDLVVMVDKISRGTPGARSITGSVPGYTAGYRSVLRRLQSAKEPVLVIRDNPAPDFDVPACLQRHLHDYAACNGSRSRWLLPDPAPTVARSLHDRRIMAVDLTDYTCGRTVCPAVVGGVPAYLDGSHLTATFDRSLAPFLEPWLFRGLAE